jgi:hypothetical protein
MFGVVRVGLVKVLFVSVCVSVVPTTAPAGLPTPPAGNVTPDVPLITTVMFVPRQQEVVGCPLQAKLNIQV